MKSFSWHLPLVLAVGAFVGYVAASGDLPRFGRAVASSSAPANRVAAKAPIPGIPTIPTTAKSSALEKRSCCSTGSVRNVLLASAQGDDVVPQRKAKPNILVIFGDDIGITNLSCYSDGLMGYETPHIDRIAKEGL